MGRPLAQHPGLCLDDHGAVVSGGARVKEVLRMAAWGMCPRSTGRMLVLLGTRRGVPRYQMSARA